MTMRRRRPTGVPIALAVVLAAITARPAEAAFCTGKANGLWCDGNALVNCQGGAAASTKVCPAGCQSNPPGVPDQCSSASGPCSGKADGAWCDGANLLQCKGGAVASSKACPNGCEVKPPGTPDLCKPAPSGPCAGKADGAWCSGSVLLQCKGGAVASSVPCPNGCEVKPPGTPDLCKPASANPCTGKADGAWCGGDALLQCKGGSQVGGQGCTYGCQSNPPGVADACKPAPIGGGPCAGKADGAWCDGGTLLTCLGGQPKASTACPHGCQAMASGVADQCKPAPQPAGPCAGQADGGWCDGDVLRICKGGQVVGTKACEAGCSGPGASASCVVPPFDPVKACAGKADGLWCVAGKLAACKGGAVIGATACPAGCQAMPPGVPDACKKPGGDPACAGKIDGAWCAGGDLVQCAGGLIVKAVSCAKGCAQPGPAVASCKVKSVGFCSGKDDGSWCDGGLLTDCSGGAAAGVFACPGGCQSNPQGVADTCKPAATPSSPAAPKGSAGVGEDAGCATFSGSIDLWKGKNLPVLNQKDYSETLGTCQGLTIVNSGCTITSLSMLHAYLGVQRSVDDKTGNSPTIENAWRKAFGGFAATSYEIGGKKLSGKCLVIWGAAPAGLVPAHGKNPSTSCLSPAAAKWIVNALKAGMPVVAGVHWPGGNASFYGSSENWHWVLIVGVDAGGPLINDPWGGKASVHLSEGGLGSYVIDDMYVFWQPGSGQGGMSPAPLDPNGEPTSEDALPKTLQYIEDSPPRRADAGQAAPADANGDAALDGSETASHAAAAGAGPAGSDGCAAAPVPVGPAGWAVALVAVALLARRRRRDPPTAQHVDVHRV